MNDYNFPEEWCSYIAERYPTLDNPQGHCWINHFWNGIELREACDAALNLIKIDLKIRMWNLGLDINNLERETVEQELP